MDGFWCRELIFQEVEILFIESPDVKNIGRTDIFVYNPVFDSFQETKPQQAQM